MGERWGRVTSEDHLGEGSEAPPPTLHSLSADGDQRHGLGRELPKVIGRRVSALDFVPAGGRRLARGKEDVVTEAYGSGPESSVGPVEV